MQWLPYTRGSFVPGLIPVTSSKIYYDLLIDIFPNSLNSFVSSNLWLFKITSCVNLILTTLIEPVTLSSVLLSHSMYSKLWVLNIPYANYPFTHNHYTVHMRACICVHPCISTREGLLWPRSDHLVHPCMPPSAFYAVAFNSVGGIY